MVISDNYSSFVVSVSYKSDAAFSSHFSVRGRNTALNPADLILVKVPQKSARCKDSRICLTTLLMIWTIFASPQTPELLAEFDITRAQRLAVFSV